tara:strand:- start:313 stop:1389 length:1077 start_codon:yes stop_codon:yes gene_type:complete
MYPSTTDSSYGESLGISMLGSIAAQDGQLFGSSTCYPGFCNPPYIFPDVTPGTQQNPTGIGSPYLPGIPAHEPGSVIGFYRGWDTEGEPGDGQQYYTFAPFLNGPLDTLGDPPNWEFFRSIIGDERILDPSLLDEEGLEPLVDITKNFSFWANTGNLPETIPAEYRDDPLYLKDWRVPNKYNERNFINDSNLECVPYPDSLGREYLRSQNYNLNTANLTILDANLPDGRTIDYATGHADIYYIVLSDGSVRAMSYRVMDSDSLVWYPARGPYNEDVTQPRIGLVGENSKTLDKEAIAFNRLNKVPQKTVESDSPPRTPASPSPTPTTTVGVTQPRTTRRTTGGSSSSGGGGGSSSYGY